MRYVDRQKERTEVTLLTTAICLGRIILEIPWFPLFPSVPHLPQGLAVVETF